MSKGFSRKKSGNWPCRKAIPVVLADSSLRGGGQSIRQDRTPFLLSAGWDLGLAWTPGMVEPGLEVPALHGQPPRQRDQIRLISCNKGHNEETASVPDP